jgi:hypothetical protein
MGIYYGKTLRRWLQHEVAYSENHYPIIGSTVGIAVIGLGNAKIPDYMNA